MATTAATAGPPSAGALARAWAEALAGTGPDTGAESGAETSAETGAENHPVPGDRPDLVVLLTGLAAGLLAALAAEPLDRAVPLRVGAALVDAHFTEARAVERTLALLGRELGAATPPERLAALFGGIAAGYARALQDRTRREQERISAATEQHRARHDPLTGLPNRTLFFERLDAALRAGTRAGVCHLDLDGFKAVNDTLGHDSGDRLLRAVARRLGDAVGPGHLVARMGGDEFVVLAEALEPGADGDEQLRALAQAALAAIRKPVRLGRTGAGNEVVVSASIGVVRADGGHDAAGLMMAADTTLYWAKAAGRNRYALYDAERHRNDVDRFEVSGRMPDALARGEFSLEFQPLVRLADRSAVGVEALVRWTLPGGRRLAPGRFVPLAEDSGFIVPLGRWVLEEACRSAAAWAAADPATPVLMSVNVAARQLREPAFVDDVATVLADTGWPARRLQLELTESALMGTPDGAPAALHALARMGVRIAIDDFGTGYSNLAYLRRLPVHTLKLAGSFVTGSAGRDGRGRDVDTVDQEVVGLVIRLAHTLGLTVTAESVETAAQFAHLRRLGCDTGQGWFFAAPVPATTVPRLLAAPLGHLR